MNIVNRILITLHLALFLTGCSTLDAVPDGYDGPVGHITDSNKVYSVKKADFFILKSVDGLPVRSSINITLSKNRGRGLYMETVIVGHEVPVGKHTIELQGKTHYAAPILALTNPEYEVRGKIQFMVEEDGEYVVKGVLGPDYSAVWIEDMRTQEVVSPKIEAYTDKAEKSK